MIQIEECIEQELLCSLEMPLSPNFHVFKKLLKFLINSEQQALQFYFALSSVNYVDGSVWK